MCLLKITVCVTRFLSLGILQFSLKPNVILYCRKQMSVFCGSYSSQNVMTMPKGTTALWIVDRYSRGFKRNVGYSFVAGNLKWLKAMYDEGIEWDCVPQGTIGKRHGKRSWTRRGSYPGSVKETYEKLLSQKT